MTHHTWVPLDPADYDHLDARSVEAFRHDGREQFLLVQTDEAWLVYAVLHADEDGFAGFESIDGSENGAEARAIGDSLVTEYLAAT